MRVGVEWIGVEWSGVEWNRWNAVEWSGLEWSISQMSANKNDYFSGQSDNFHFSKVSQTFSFCQGRAKMDLKSRVAPTNDVLENAF